MNQESGSESLEAVSVSPTRVEMSLRIERFRLPPVESALLIGRRAAIGANAMAKALDEMLPGQFVKIEVEHPDVEALLVRRTHLRRVPEQRLSRVLLRHAEGVMDDTDMLHVDLSIAINVTESFEV